MKGMITNMIIKTNSEAETIELGKKIGSKLIPGVNIASWVASGLALINGLVYKNSGFLIEVSYVYSSVFIHSQGHEMYGWDLKDLNVTTFKENQN